MGVIFTKEINPGQKMKVNVEMYNNAQDVVDDCQKRKIVNSSFDDMAERSIDEDWEGVNSYDEALNLLRDGYEKCLDDFKTIVKDGTIQVDKRTSFENNVYGFAPVVPLAIIGVPQNMVNTRTKVMKQKVVDIYYDSTMPCWASPDEIIKNGLTVLKNVIELERKNYRVNLYAVQTYNDSKSSDVLCVKVKSADRALDLKRMSFPIAHSAFFRVIGFDWYSKMPKSKYRSGYGHAIDRELDGDDLQQFGKQIFGNNAVFITARSIENMDSIIKKHIGEEVKR